MIALGRFAGYDAEAEFYDYCWSSLVEDIKFYKRRLSKPGRVLDLMSGTGRVGLALARAGCEVDGIERSAGMLRIARRKLGRLPAGVRPRLHLHRGDLMAFNLPKGFDAAVIPVDSYPLILSRGDRVRALRNVRRHLKAAGKLLLHIDTPRSYETARAGAPSVSVFRVDGEQKTYIRVLVESYVRPDLVRGITAHVMVNRSGRVERRITTETRTRVLSISGVVRELSDAGFSRSRLFGDYSGGRLTRSSSFAVIESSA